MTGTRGQPRRGQRAEGAKESRGRTRPSEKVMDLDTKPQRGPTDATLKVEVSLAGGTRPRGSGGEHVRGCAAGQSRAWASVVCAQGTGRGRRQPGGPGWGCAGAQPPQEPAVPICRNIWQQTRQPAVWPLGRGPRGPTGVSGRTAGRTVVQAGWTEVEEPELGQSAWQGRWPASRTGHPSRTGCKR